MSGIFSKEQEKVIIDLIDDLIKGNAITEPLSDLALKILVPLVDNTLIERVVVKLNLSDLDVTQLRGAIDAIISKDYETAGDLLGEFTNNKVNIPGIDETTEAFLFAGVYSIIVAALKNRIEANSQPSAPGSDSGDEEDDDV